MAATINEVNLDGFDRMTLRENEILQLMASNWLTSSREIARVMVISERTLQSHFANMFKKVNVTDRTLLCLAYIEHQRRRKS